MSAKSTNLSQQQAAAKLTTSIPPKHERSDSTSDFAARKFAEGAIAESEARFREVWETTSDAMALSDAQGIVLEANPAYQLLYGYTADTLIGQSFALIFPAAERAQAVEQYKAVFTNQAELPVFETKVRRSDGSVRIVKAHATFLSTAGQRTVMLSTIHDITERKQAEERLQVIYALSTAVNRAPALEQIYTAALNALIEVLHVNRAAILLVDEAGVMRFKAWHRLSETYRQQAEGHKPWLTTDLQPQPVIIPNVSEAALGELREIILQEGIGALAFIPLVEQGRLLGKFMLYYDQPALFPMAEVQWAQAIGQHVTHALERTYAEAQLRHLNATLEQRVADRTLALEQRNQG